MILPTKHLRTERSLLGVGAEILSLLTKPMTVSSLWNAMRTQRSEATSEPPIDYRWFVLTLDLLYLIGALELQSGILQKHSE